MKKLIFLLVFAFLLLPALGGAEIDLATLPADVTQALLAGQATPPKDGVMSQALLPAVVSLDLRGTTSLPEQQRNELLAALPNLQTLNLSDLGLAGLDGLPVMEQLQALYLNGNELQALTGLEKQPALLRLSLAGNPIADFSALDQCKKLKKLILGAEGYAPRASAERISLKYVEELDLSYTGDALLQKLGKLGKLPKLTDINLTGCGLTDLSALTPYAAKLTILDISNNPGVDLSLLTKLKKLKGLGLDACELSDESNLTPIGKCKNLMVLSIANNRIRDFSFIKQNKKLQRLYAGGNPYLPSGDDYPSQAVEDAVNAELDERVYGSKNVFAAEQLRYLSLKDLNLSDMSFLRFFPHLEQLTLEGCTFTTAGPIGQLAQLTTLHLDKCSVFDLGVLAKLTALEDLRLRATPAAGDAASLSGCKALQRLELDECGLSDLTALSALKKLDTLDVSRNPIADLGPIAKLKKLKELNITGTQAGDLSALKGLTNLKFLYMDEIPAVDFTPLKKLTKLSSLSVDAPAFTDAAMLKPLKKLQNVSCSYVTQSTAELAKLLPKGCTISCSTVGDQAVAALASLVEKKVAAAGGIPPEGLSDEEYQSVTTLNLSDVRLTDIDFLTKFPNLYRVALGRNGSPVDLQPLAELKKLSSLYLDDPTQEQLAQLEAIDQVTYLTIQPAKPLDYSPLDQMAALKYLTLEPGGGPVELASLGNVKGLEQLTLYGGSVDETDFSPLKNCEGLRSLSLFNVIVTDLSSIGQLTQLELLDIECFAVTDLSPLTGMQLRQLNGNVQTQAELDAVNALSLQSEDGPAYINLTVNTEFFGQARRMMEAYAQQQTREAADKLAAGQEIGTEQKEKITNFVLNFHENPSASMDLLREMPQLTHLTIYGDDPVSPAALTELTELQSLTMYCPAEDYRFLSELTKLTELTLRCEEPLDAALIARLTELTALDINVPLTDTGVLAQLPKLQSLTLNNEPGDDLSAVPTLTGLTRLTLETAGDLTLEMLCGLSQLESLSLRSMAEGQNYAALSRLVNLRFLTIPVYTDADVQAVAQLRGMMSLTLICGDIRRPLHDVSALTDMTQLQGLDIENFDRVDLRPLAKLPTLTWLRFASASVADPGQLPLLSQLQSLSLYESTLDDYAPLMQMKWLTSLFINGDYRLTEEAAQALRQALPTTDLTLYTAEPDALDEQINSFIGRYGYLPEGLFPDSALDRVTALDVWSYEEQPIADLGFITRLPHLSSLDFTWSAETDVSALASATALTSLTVRVREGERLPNIDFVAPLTGLRSLYVDNGEGCDLSAAGGLTALETLDLWLYDPSLSFADMARLPSLRTLRLCAPEGTDTSALPLLTQLTTLDLNLWTQADVQAMSRLTGLETLYVQLEKPLDPSPLAALIGLKSLELQGWSGNNLQWLAALPALETLGLRQCTLSDMDALSGAKALRELSLDDTPLPPVELLQSLQPLQQLAVWNEDFTQAQYEQLMAALPGVSIVCAFSPEE